MSKQKINKLLIGTNNKGKLKEITPEEKIIELEDKITRTFAEMENQRRRFEKEKEEAFDYGGFSFAKEALNLIDNLERSKHTLKSDQSLKDTEALKKILDHLEIINKDLISIFSKSNIKPIECLTIFNWTLEIKLICRMNFDVFWQQTLNFT